MVGWTFSKCTPPNKHFKGILYLPLLRQFPYRCVMVGRIPFEIAPAAALRLRKDTNKYWKHITLEILHSNVLISFIFILFIFKRWFVYNFWASLAIRDGWSEASQRFSHFLCFLYPQPPRLPSFLLWHGDGHDDHDGRNGDLPFEQAVVEDGMVMIMMIMMVAMVFYLLSRLW